MILSTHIEMVECMNEQMQMIEKLRKKVLWRYIVMIVLPFAAGISAILMLRRGMLTSGETIGDGSERSRTVPGRPRTVPNRPAVRKVVQE